MLQESERFSGSQDLKGSDGRAPAHHPLPSRIPTCPKVRFDLCPLPSYAGSTEGSSLALYDKDFLNP